MPQTNNAEKDRPKTHDDYMRAARGLVPLIEAEADEAERLTHQTDKVVAALRDAGIYHMLLPKELGGAQRPFVEAMEVVELISWADGSAGWGAMVGNAIAASVGSFIPEKGAQQLYGERTFRMGAGQGVPRGQARRVDGGYMIKGPWSYGSTIYHAEFVHSGCVLMDGDKPKKDAKGNIEAIVCHFDKSEIELQGNWNTLGLRATGSYDYTLKNKELFVPEYMCYPFTGVPPQRGGMQFSVGIIGFTSWCHTAWAIGIGRRVLDEIAKIARVKGNVFGLVGESVHFKHQFAEAESKFRAARAFCYEVWTDISETLERGQPATVEQIALIRMAMRHMHDVDSEIATFAHRAGGGVALRPSVLQRCYRDIHTGTQHLLLSDQIYEECARVMLGMYGKNPRWNAFSVLDDGPAEAKK